MEMNYKVYVHINKVNGKRYYGITCKKVEYRWNSGKGYKFYIDKEGKEHGNKHFWSSICKYGWNEGFEHIVIARGLTEEEAKWLEIELIREHDTTNPEYGYNISLGGNIPSEETRRKLSEAGKRRIMSKESRKKIGEAHKGKIVSEETRKKMSESRKGKYKGKNSPMYGKHRSEETKKKISEANKGKTSHMKGKKHSEETKKKISEANKGYKPTEETRRKLSEANSGKNNPMYGKTHNEEARKKISEAQKKQIYCKELDMYFDTVTEGAEYIGRSIGSISDTLRGKTKTCGGYHWVYVKEVNKENINKVISKEYNKRWNEGKNNPRAKQIYCKELDMYFETVKEASKFVECDSSNISKVLNGRQKTCGGYHWLYAEDVETIEIENSKKVS